MCNVHFTCANMHAMYIDGFATSRTTAATTRTSRRTTARTRTGAAPRASSSARTTSAYRTAGVATTTTTVATSQTRRTAATTSVDQTTSSALLDTASNSTSVVMETGQFRIVRILFSVPHDHHSISMYTVNLFRLTKWTGIYIPFILIYLQNEFIAD